EMSVSSNNWMNAAIGAANLCLTELVAGAIAEATATAKKVVEYGHRSESAEIESRSIVFPGVCFLAAGQREDVERFFLAGEQLQRKYDAESAYLYSTLGFYF